MDQPQHNQFKQQPVSIWAHKQTGRVTTTAHITGPGPTASGCYQELEAHLTQNSSLYYEEATGQTSGSSISELYKQQTARNVCYRSTSIQALRCCSASAKTIVRRCSYDETRQQQLHDGSAGLNSCISDCPTSYLNVTPVRLQRSTESNSAPDRTKLRLQLSPVYKKVLKKHKVVEQQRQQLQLPFKKSFSTTLPPLDNTRLEHGTNSSTSVSTNGQLYQRKYTTVDRNLATAALHSAEANRLLAKHTVPKVVTIQEHYAMSHGQASGVVAATNGRGGSLSFYNSSSVLLRTSVPASARQQQQQSISYSTWQRFVARNQRYELQQRERNNRRRRQQPWESLCLAHDDEAAEITNTVPCTAGSLPLQHHHQQQLKMTAETNGYCEQQQLDPVWTPAICGTHRSNSANNTKATAVIDGKYNEKQLLQTRRTCSQCCCTKNYSTTVQHRPMATRNDNNDCEIMRLLNISKTTDTTPVPTAQEARHTAQLVQHERKPGKDELLV